MANMLVAKAKTAMVLRIDVRMIFLLRAASCGVRIALSLSR